MLTEFSIGNYQAFNTPQRVPLKPITLIFGPNSAGKSALLRSLLVARHAILNGKLSKSEGAGERHPGSYADIVRNGNTNPISFGFTVQPEGENCGEALELGLAWKESLPGNLETVALSVRQMHSEVVTYSTNCDSKHLQIHNLGKTLQELMAYSRLDSDAKGILDEAVQNSIKKRLSLQRNVAIPGTDEDHFRIEDRNLDEFDFFSAIEASHDQGKYAELFQELIQKSNIVVDALKSSISKQIKMGNTSLRDVLTNLIYHGPIRPICDEITKAQQSEPGMTEWWNLAADQKLLAKVNIWLASDIFKTKYRLEFDRLFPDSSLQQLLRALSGEHNIEALVEVAFDAKLNTDNAFYESQIDQVVSGLKGCLNYEKEDEAELTTSLRQQAHDIIYDDARRRGIDHYNSLLADSDVDEIESFLLGGFNRTLADLRGMLESVRQGRGNKTPGGFDSAKVRFSSTTSSQSVSPTNMGIGFSQMMPLVASAFGSEKSLIAIEQPELHVHPALQTELADLFIQSAKERGNRFLIETHSEHLILRLLRRVRETNDGQLEPGRLPLYPEDLCVLYVQPGDQGSEVIELPVTPDGDFSRPWPNGFFAERSAELF